MSLRRALGVVETAGVSVAIMAPTAAMALNGALAASYAGPAVPLAFVLAFGTIACVAFAFITFARVYATPASVGEFNARGLGPLAGRLSAWALLLVYILFAAGSAAELGAFAAAAAAYGGFKIHWLIPALAALAVCAYTGTRRAKTSSRTMLALEGLSVAAIVALSVLILLHRGAHGVTLTPFTPIGTTLGGLGLATVFALLSFAGFEGAAFLGAESLNPLRTIPRALIGSVLIVGILYVFVAFAQTIGFGADAKGVAAFAASSSPLGDLAQRYASGRFAQVVMIGATISAFAATLAPATGAARLLYSFALESRLPATFSRIQEPSGTPAFAFLFVLAIDIMLVLLFSLARQSGTDTFAACGTVAILALILVYAAVQISALRLFAARWPFGARIVPIVALASLAFTFAANVVPVPHGIAATYPYLVLAWLTIGTLVLNDRTRRHR
ncbi:MAG: amino acid permease [Vulcanimicrobiaceae bacterium]